MLTAHSLDPKSLKRSIEMGARAYLPKEKLGRSFLSWKIFWNPPMVHLLGAPDEHIRRIFCGPLGRIMEEVRGEILERFREKDLPY